MNETDQSISALVKSDYHPANFLQENYQPLLGPLTEHHITLSPYFLLRFKAAFLIYP